MCIRTMNNMLGYFRVILIAFYKYQVYILFQVHHTACIKISMHIGKQGGTLWCMAGVCQCMAAPLFKKRPGVNTDTAYAAAPLLCVLLLEIESSVYFY